MLPRIVISKMLHAVISNLNIVAEGLPNTTSNLSSLVFSTGNAIFNPYFFLHLLLFQNLPGPSDCRDFSLIYHSGFFKWPSASKLIREGLTVNLLK